MVAVMLLDEQLPAALLVWARSEDGWRAGLCYPTAAGTAQRRW